MPETRAAGNVVLCVNAGSSSLKLALYRMAPDAETVCARGAIEGIGQPKGHLWLIEDGQQSLVDTQKPFADYQSAIEAGFDALEGTSLPRPEAIGHRLVHGGPDHAAPERVTPELVRELRGMVSLAPLHLPKEIGVLDAIATRYPSLPQVACFDTAFHRRMPEVAQRFPLPRELWDDGLRRYGFHGISYEYILGRLGAAATDRVIIAHLGNGASMVAVRDGRSLDTTMGFTPTGGLMMGTRSGDLDPGVMLYLLREKHLTYDQLETMVDERSGLIGVSATFSDMKTLLDKSPTDPRAAEAIEMFCYHAGKHIGALTAVLGGVDTLVFTGGIGERAAPVREMICRGLEHLGIRIAPAKNQSNSDTISTADSLCTVRVIRTDEDLMIARHTWQLLFAPKR